MQTLSGRNPVLWRPFFRGASFSVPFFHSVLFWAGRHISQGPACLELSCQPCSRPEGTPAVFPTLTPLPLSKQQRSSPVISISQFQLFTWRGKPLLFRCSSLSRFRELSPCNRLMQVLDDPRLDVMLDVRLHVVQINVMPIHA